MCHAAFGAWGVVSKSGSSLNTLVFVHSPSGRSEASIVYDKVYLWTRRLHGVR